MPSICIAGYPAGIPLRAEHVHAMHLYYGMPRRGIKYLMDILFFYSLYKLKTYSSTVARLGSKQQPTRMETMRTPLAL